VVALSDVTVHRGTTVALADADLAVSRGEVIGILGPNGAGKTTLLETIQGYLRPSTGEVRVFGADPATDTHRIADRWGVMPQTSGLPMGLTVRESVQLFRDLHGSTSSIADVLAMTDLTHLADRRWRSLSGGEQQRLSLAVALCGGTDLLMLDEPTAAVDVEGRDRILSLVAHLGGTGSTILITTHRFDDLDHVASRVVMLDRGRVVADAPIDELTSDRDRVRFEAAPGLDLTDLTTELGAGIETSPGVYQVDAPAGPASVATLAAWLAERGIEARSIESGRASLEDRYRELTGGGE
jgi:ABC-2 type transport system ATP-binding protein